MNVFAVTLPMPPSANNMFATFNGRRIISREYKAWRAENGDTIRNAWIAQGSPRFEQHLAITIHLGLNYRGDIDNRVKGVLDTLGEAIPDFPNDRWIDRLEVERVPGIDGARVLVQQLAPPSERRGEAVAIGALVPGILSNILAKMPGGAA